MKWLPYGRYKRRRDRHYEVPFLSPSVWKSLFRSPEKGEDGQGGNHRREDPSEGEVKGDVAAATDARAVGLDRARHLRDRSG